MACLRSLSHEISEIGVDLGLRGLIKSNPAQLNELCLEYAEQAGDQEFN